MMCVARHIGEVKAGNLLHNRANGTWISSEGPMLANTHPPDSSTSMTGKSSSGHRQAHHVEAEEVEVHRRLVAPRDLSCRVFIMCQAVAEGGHHPEQVLARCLP